MFSFDSLNLLKTGHIFFIQKMEYALELPLDLKLALEFMFVFAKVTQIMEITIPYPSPQYF